jgi:hypothetical protein
MFHTTLAFDIEFISNFSMASRRMIEYLNLCYSMGSCSCMHRDGLITST